MRARMSMRWMITLFTACFLAVSLGLVLTATLREAQRQWIQASVLRARAVTVLIAQSCRQGLRDGDAPALDALVRRVAVGDMLQRVIVADGAGRVIADSARFASAPSLLQVTPSLKEEPRVAIHAEVVEVLLPVRHAGATLGAVYVRSSRWEHQAMARAMLRRGIRIGLLFILAGCVIAYSLAGVISAPLQRLARRMNSIARNQPAQRLAEEGCLEQAQMARSFNTMADALHRRQDELESLPALGLAVSRSLNLEEVARAAVEGVERAMVGTTAQIWLRDPQGHCLVAGPGVSGLMDPVVPSSSRHLLESILARRKAHLAGEERTPVDAWFAEQFGARSMAAVPLCAGPKGVGVLVVFRTGDDSLEPEDLPFLSAAANQIALCIENARLFTREAHMASLLQRQLLPPAPASIPGLEIEARWRPAPGDAQVGGDYYDFISLPDGRWGIVIGDVCGKGTLAASYTTMAKYVLRSYAHESDSPAEILQRTNAALHAQIGGAGPDDDAPSFITMLCAIYDPAHGQLTYSHAGHPLGTLVTTGNGATVHLDCGGPPVGVLPDATYQEQTLSLAPGDTLALYSDGVVEAARSEYLLEADRIGEILLAHHREPVSAAADAVVEEVERLANGGAYDDVTLLVLRVKDAVPTLTIPPAPRELAKN